MLIEARIIIYLFCRCSILHFQQQSPPLIRNFGTSLSTLFLGTYYLEIEWWVTFSRSLFIICLVIILKLILILNLKVGGWIYCRGLDWVTGLCWLWVRANLFLAMKLELSISETLHWYLDSFLPTIRSCSFTTEINYFLPTPPCYSLYYFALASNSWHNCSTWLLAAWWVWTWDPHCLPHCPETAIQRDSWVNQPRRVSPRQYKTKESLSIWSSIRIWSGVYPFL